MIRSANAIESTGPASLRGIFEAKSALLRGEGHRLRCATLCRASLRYGGAWEYCDGESGGRGLQKDIGKSAREWHFDPEGKDKG
jgi:hypothetical protein